MTLVTWGNCVALAEEAIEQVAERGVSVELLDLRTLSPLDDAGIEESLRKTGRLVVVHEDARTTGVGQAIVTEMTAHQDRFSLLYSAPQLVARENTYIGFNPVLEYAALPSVAQVVEAIERVMA